MDGSAEDVVVAGPAATVRLTEAQWASFRQVGGREHAARAVEVAAWPQEVPLPTASLGSAVALSLPAHLPGPRSHRQSLLPSPPLRVYGERAARATPPPP